MHPGARACRRRWCTGAGAESLAYPALLVPEAHGGLGPTLLDAAIVSEELGRAVAPVPFLGSAVLAPLALIEAGSANQKAEWLPRLASGNATIGIAFTEALSGAREGAGVWRAQGGLNGSVWYAAHAFDVAPEEAPLYAAHAKALLSEAGRFVARTATEVHGGIGITDELGLHYRFKRLAFDRTFYGSPEHARRHAASLQGLLEEA